MAELPQAVKDYFARISKQGGKARAKKLNSKERAEIARQGARARWAKQKPKPTAPKPS